MVQDLLKLMSLAYILLFMIVFSSANEEWGLEF